MKKPILLLSILLFTLSLKSQIVEDWTTPIALTSSIDISSNPVIVVLQVNGTDELFMIYEKASWSGTSEIWWKKISDPMAEEEILIPGWPNLDYRNPQVLFNSFLIYECPILGNYDLFGVAFDENGLVGDSFQLTNSEQDINSFYAPSYYSDRCGWVSEGAIISGQIQSSQDTLMFINIDTIDSGDCFDPVCNGDFIAWRKVENDESHIYYSKFISSSWSVPDTIIKTSDNINLSLSTTIPELGGGYTLCWEATDKIYFTGIWWSPFYISSPEISGIEKYYEPTAFNVAILTESIPELFSFAGEAASDRDIYIVDYQSSGQIPVNISDDSLYNKNPRLFSGRINWPYYEVINIWQTEIDGHDVLSESHVWYLATGSINEDVLFQMDVSPNPVYGNQNVMIIPRENILITSVQVYSSAGDLVLEKKFNSRSHQYEFDLNTNLPGVYFIKIRTSRGATVRKIIKM